jgi:hypothetical protein
VRGVVSVARVSRLGPEIVDALDVLDGLDGLDTQDRFRPALKGFKILKDLKILHLETSARVSVWTANRSPGE